MPHSFYSSSRMTGKWKGNGKKSIFLLSALFGNFQFTSSLSTWSGCALPSPSPHPRSLSSPPPSSPLLPHRFSPLLPPPSLSPPLSPLLPLSLSSSPSGCTFWGKKPWSRKKKILWQLGTLVGAPVGIALIAGIAIPAMIIGIPVYVGRKVRPHVDLVVTQLQYKSLVSVRTGCYYSISSEHHSNADCNTTTHYSTKNVSPS